MDSGTGVAGGYRLGEGASLPPLNLDEDEATAVFVGLHTAAGTGVTGAGTASVRALAKLERVLPPRLRRRLASLHGSVLKLRDRAPTMSLSDVALLATACSERLLTHVTYRARGGEKSERTVEPFRLVRVGPLWYLVAWDVSKDAWRTFRVDRITRLEASSRRFKARPPPGDDLERYVTESLSSAPYAHRARVVLHSPIESLRARIGPYDGVLERVSDDRCILETGAPSLDGLAFMIARLGVEFDVLEPEELVPCVRALGVRLTRCKRVP